MSDNDDPNAIGPWRDDLVADARAARYFLHPEAHGGEHFAAADRNAGVSVHVDGLGDNVVCSSREDADALLLRLYPPRTRQPAAGVGTLSALPPGVVALVGGSGSSGGAGPTLEVAPMTRTERALRESHIAGVSAGLAAAVAVVVKARRPDLAKQIAEAGTALVARIRSQPPTGGEG